MNFLFNCFEFINNILDWIIHSNDPELPTVLEYELQPVSSFQRTEPTPSLPLAPTSPQLRLRRQACEEELQIPINDLVTDLTVTTSITNEVKGANRANEIVEEPIDFEIIEMPDIEDQKKSFITYCLESRMVNAIQAPNKPSSPTANTKTKSMKLH